MTCRMFPLRSHRNTRACSSFLLRLSKVQPFNVNRPRLQVWKMCAKCRDIASGVERHRNKWRHLARPKCTPSVYASCDIQFICRSVHWFFLVMLWVECELARIQIRTRPSALSFQPCEDYTEPPLPLLLVEIDPLPAQVPTLVSVDVQEFRNIHNS